MIADEAHRSQYGFRARVDRKTGEISYGFAKYLRDALPNASFIGFTGTPLDEDLRPMIDNEIAELTEDEAQDEQEHLKRE